MALPEQRLYLGDKPRLTRPPKLFEAVFDPPSNVGGLGLDRAAVRAATVRVRTYRKLCTVTLEAHVLDVSTVTITII
jgi:hypothetical protein